MHYINKNYVLKPIYNDENECINDTLSIILAFYVDDIILTGSDDTGILVTKTYLQQHLNIRDLGSPRYFLGIKFTHQEGKLTLTLRNYALDMLKET